MIYCSILPHVLWKIATMRGDTTQMKAWSLSHTRAAILQPPITGCRRLAISKIQVHKLLSLSLSVSLSTFSFWHFYRISGSIEYWNYSHIEAGNSWFRIGDTRSRWRTGGNRRGRRRGGHPTTKTTAHRPKQFFSHAVIPCPCHNTEHGIQVDVPSYSRA